MLLYKLIDELGLKVGIEVGVRHGDNCRNILKTNVDKLYGLDIRFDQKAGSISDPRFTYLIGSSPTYASNFPDQSFDFIYIDAGHSYEDVRADLEAWWPKLRYDGLFCGDDYFSLHNPTEGDYGVVEAVEEFASNYMRKVNINDTGMTKTDRLKFASHWGKKHEDNLYLVHEYIVGKEACEGRVKTESGIPFGFWWMIK